MTDTVIDVARLFDVCGKPISFSECVAGHINNTYVVSFYDGVSEEKYVLQKINTYVFKQPEQVMSNIIGVTTYLRELIQKNGGDPWRETLNFVPCRDGKYFYRDESNGYWRMYRYVDNVVSYSQADSADLFERSGIAFGKFQLQLANYDSSALYETIPDFHNTRKRFLRFLDVLKESPDDRRLEAADDIEFVLNHERCCSLIVDALNDKQIPTRVTHNDTKLNNILMDPVTGEGVCIIDLDTVMPGSALYDFGDAIRFGASNALEDETDLDKVYFRADMFEAFARGYINGSAGALTQYEIESLPIGALVITFETGMRFLTDYLENDVYFKIAYPKHNLDRARNQFKLVFDMEKRINEFNDIIKKII